MAESNENSNKNIMSENDPLDINELASLNEDFSVDFLEKLQNNITDKVKSSSDGAMFEEVPSNTSENKNANVFNSDIDDNFIKKYKAKLQKQQTIAKEIKEDTVSKPASKEASDEDSDSVSAASRKDSIENPDDQLINRSDPNKKQNINPLEEKGDIETLSGGNITERPVTQESIEYNESLNYLDGNVKYSKYVIYIDPENKDFVDSLTVKERKNLINRIIREQDSIAITKRKLGKMQTILTHVIISILTVTLSIPCIYWAINASLEATINNYRNSQSAFGILYKERGKIKTNKASH